MQAAAVANTQAAAAYQTHKHYLSLQYTGCPETLMCQVQS
jgi:hypothetical protein